MRRTNPPVNKHAHEHELDEEPPVVYFEDGAFIEHHECSYTEGKTYTDYERDETYYDVRYECEYDESTRYDMDTIIRTDTETEIDPDSELLEAIDLTIHSTLCDSGVQVRGDILSGRTDPDAIDVNTIDGPYIVTVTVDGTDYRVRFEQGGEL
jgi:hypothetical protein